MCLSLGRKGSLKVYRGASAEAGNQYLRIDPTGSELIEYNVSSELREFTIAIKDIYSIIIYFKLKA